MHRHTRTKRIKGQATRSQSSTGSLRHLVAGRSVAIKRITTDRYGRSVAELVVNGTNVQQRLVSAGHAVVLQRYAHQCPWALKACEQDQRCRSIGSALGCIDLNPPSVAMTTLRLPSSPMPEEQLKAFLEAVKTDASLQEKLKASDNADAVVVIAKESGFSVSTDDFSKTQSALTEEELENLAGGNWSSCICQDTA